MSADEPKAALRARLRALRRGLAPDQRRREAAEAAELLWRLLAGTADLASYCALPDELDLAPLHRRWWADGRALWLPRVAGPGLLAWHRVGGTEQLAPGAYGISEPDPARNPAAPLPAAATVLVPGIAFGGDGRRLGQGGGFYDRFLCGHPGPVIGIGFACQRCDGLPQDPHDRRCGRLVLGGQLIDARP